MTQTDSRERILVVRTSALGDVVNSLPVLAALRRHRPGAVIGWVVEEAMAPVLDGHPDLDELIVARFRPWRSDLLTAATWREIGAFAGRLQGFAADVVLDLMGNHKSAAIAALSMADRRIGAAWADRREPSSGLWINQPVAPGDGHAVDRSLALLDALELPREPADFGGDKLFPEVPEGAASLLDQRSSPFFLIQSGAGWGNKRYPAERWAEVARRLKEVTWIDSLAVAGPGETELTEEIEAAGQGAVRAVKAPTLPFLAALIRRSVMVLGGDTGPIHLARALGTPVLALMGPTDPATHGPYDLPHQAMALKLPCSYCHQRLDEPRACLLDIDPRDVAERAAAALEGPAASLD